MTSKVTNASQIHTRRILVLTAKNLGGDVTRRLRKIARNCLKQVVLFGDRKPRKGTVDYNLHRLRVDDIGRADQRIRCRLRLVKTDKSPLTLPVLMGNGQLVQPVARLVSRSVRVSRDGWSGNSYTVNGVCLRISKQGSAPSVQT